MARGSGMAPTRRRKPTPADTGPRATVADFYRWLLAAPEPQPVPTYALYLEWSTQ